MRKLAWITVLGLLFAYLLGGCGEIVPIYSKIHKVPDLTLHFADQPVEFSIKTDAPEPVLQTRLELTVYCDKSTFKQESLPLMLILEGPDLDLQEFAVSVPVMKDGEWLGEMDDNQVDVRIVHDAIELLDLQSPGKYTLKVVPFPSSLTTSILPLLSSTNS